MSTTPAILVDPFIIELVSPVVRRASRPRYAAPYLCSDRARRAMAAAWRRKATYRLASRDPNGALARREGRGAHLGDCEVRAQSEDEPVLGPAVHVPGAAAQLRDLSPPAALAAPAMAVTPSA
jgi:hypothetical protein